MHRRLPLLRAWFVAGLLAAAVAGQEKKPTPEEWLESQGLRRLSSQFALPEEGEFSKLLRQASDLQKSLADAQKKVAELDRQKTESDRMITEYLQQYRQLNAQLAVTPPGPNYNKIVLASNELAARIQILQQTSQDEAPRREARAAANKLAEEYIELLLKARSMHDSIRAKYAELAANAVVARAIARVSESEGKKFTLGPTSSLESNSRRLAKMEQSILSEAITLRRGNSGLWFVSVMLNGTHAEEMAIDTGASIVVLPFEVAQKANLRTEDDPNAPMTLTMGDGSQVRATRAVADSIRVGQFTVENVECAILPPNLPRSMPLLGQTYLQNFAYKIDSATGKLLITKVESEDPPPRDRRK